jgi:hypothetical protein
MIPQTILKAASYFVGSKTRRPDLQVVRVRSEGGSATLVTEATDGHIAIQITSNDSEYELDDFSMLMSVDTIKRHLKGEEEVNFEDDDGHFPDIDAAVEQAKNQDEMHPATIQLQFLAAASLALRAMFTETNVALHASENIHLPLTLSTNGTTRDNEEVVVDIFIMGMRTN